MDELKEQVPQPDSEENIKDRAEKMETLDHLIQDTYDAMSEVMFEIAEAKREQQRCDKILNPRRRKKRPDMGRQIFTELRRYSKPPAHVSKLVQTFLLLLGFDEYTTFVNARKK